MGVCNSSPKKAKRINKSMNLDFEYFRDEVKRNTDNKVYEVKAHLYDIIQTAPKITTTNLINKYLFFEPSGRFSSRVKQRISGEELFIDGVLQKNGTISILHKQKILHNNVTKTTYYESKVELTNNNTDNKLLESEARLQATGQVFEDVGEGKVALNNTNFLLKFCGKQWQIEFSTRKESVNIVCFLKIEAGGVFSGISYDKKGFAVWSGHESGTTNTVVLIQQYIDKDNQPGNMTQELGTFSYQGVFDKINNTIAGTVKNRELDNETQFLMKYMSRAKII